MNATLRLTALLPLRARDAIGNAMGGKDAITHPDHGARAAYEARMERTIAAARSSDAAPEAGPPAQPAPAQPAPAQPAQPAPAEPEAAQPAAEPAPPPEREPEPAREPEAV